MATGGLYRERVMKNPCCLKEIGLIDFIFFLYKTADSLLDPVVKLYIYHQLCKRHTGTNCDNHEAEKEIKVQEEAAFYLMVYKILLHTPAIFWGLLCGAWSDRVGRKTPMILSCFGLLLSSTTYAVSTISDDLSLPIVCAGAAIYGIFGKSAVMTMAVHSYASDVTMEEKRTNKLGILLAMNFYGLFVGSLLAGFFISLFTYAIMFMIVVLIISANILIITFLLKETINPETINPDSEEFQQKPPVSLCRAQNLSDSTRVLFRRREHGRHWVVLLFFCTLFINQACKAGENDVTLLFVQMAPLSWNDSMYGYLLAFDFACFGLVLCSILPILSDIVQVSDDRLIVIGIVSKLGRLVLMAFSTHTWMVYSAVFVGASTVILISSAKSFLSKNVDENEIGKLFSLISCGETVANLVGVVVFNSIYSCVVDVFPGMTFLIEAGLYLILLIIVLMYSIRRTDPETVSLLRADSESSMADITMAETDQTVKDTDGD